MTGRLITQSDILYSVKRRLRLGNSDNDLDLHKLINDGIKNTDTLDTFVTKNTEVAVEDFAIELPCDMITLLGVRFVAPVSSTTAPAIQTCDFGVYVNKTFFESCGVACNGFSYLQSIQIQGNQILLDSSNHATSAIIAYTSLDTDDNGLMHVSEDYERGVTAYVAYQFALIYAEKYSPLQINEWKEEWKAQKKLLKAKAWTRKFREQRKAIMSTINALITDKGYYQPGL